MFIIVNIAAMPPFAAPTSQPVAPSKAIVQVGLAWSPSLCSRPTTLTALARPGVPSASGMNFGTMNRLMPRLPAGAPGRRARTR